jgi:hypothetical protein
MSARAQSSTGSRLLLAAIALVFCTGPTPGDVGGCGQEPDNLDPPTFFATKKAIDCARCEECGFVTQSCLDACDQTVPWETEFPEDCFPLVHDGEVCLRALQYASCGEYEEYMSDVAPTTASECNFCPPRGGQ